MISNPQLLREYKARMLKTLNDYAGVAARETQLLPISRLITCHPPAWRMCSRC